MNKTHIKNIYILAGGCCTEKYRKFIVHNIAYNSIYLKILHIN